jgi:BMFP domain-containing protein YqiC
MDLQTIPRALRSLTVPGRFRRIQRRWRKPVDQPGPQLRRDIEFLARHRLALGFESIDLIARLMKLELACRVGCTGRLRPVLIVSLPKSGTWYVQDKLRERLGLDIARVFDGPRIETFHFNRQTHFAWGGSVAAGHPDPTQENFSAIAEANIAVLLLTRDPRQAVFSYLDMVEREYAVHPSRVRDPQLPGEFGALSAKQKAAWAAETKLPTFLNWLDGWCAAAQTMPDHILHCRFDTMLADETTYFHRILEFLDVRPDLWFSEPEEVRRADAESGVQWTGAPADRWQCNLDEDMVRYVDSLCGNRGY